MSRKPETIATSEFVNVIGRQIWLILRYEMNHGTTMDSLVSIFVSTVFGTLLIVADTTLTLAVKQTSGRQGNGRPRTGISPGNIERSH
jgi:hypothetical protein